jgi:hypothetical protein
LRGADAEHGLAVRAAAVHAWLVTRHGDNHSSMRDSPAARLPRTRPGVRFGGKPTTAQGGRTCPANSSCFTTEPGIPPRIAPASYALPS